MEHSGFNVIDLSVLGILVLSGVLAFFRGFVREIFSLGTWTGAAALAVFLYPIAKPWVAQHFGLKNEMAVDAASALGLFCASLIVLIPIGNLCAGLVKGDTLTAIDRSLGFVFGLVRGALILCILYLGMTFLWSDPAKLPNWLAEAKTRPILTMGAEAIRSFVPKDKQEKAADEVRKTKESADRAAEDAQRLQNIATPTPATTKPVIDPVYTDEIRKGLNEFIDQKK